MKIAYICDGKRCERCSDSCHHTLDINHAKNFEKLCDDLGNVLAYQELDPARHGKWIDKSYESGPCWRTLYECSECGAQTSADIKQFKYCPACGARMVEE